jgi:ribosomal protein S18 acetylase RimI-like enzyme
LEGNSRIWKRGELQQGKGYGEFLLADALRRAAQSEIASFAAIVDATDESARRFYEREGFLSFPDQPMKLFRPMIDLRRLFE